MISIKQFIRSMRAAGRGIGAVAREEQSFRVQLLAALGVVILITVMDLAVWEAVALSMMAGIRDYQYSI
jgi:diacylglycerol kinase